MITCVNSSNADLYTAKFSEATQALINAGILEVEKGPDGQPKKNDQGQKIAKSPITTVEEYFAYLPKLVLLGDSDKKYDKLRSVGRRYTKLPLDEEVMKVDGNTRDIIMPQTFLKNGFSVQGDKFAETVYFVVDRFFDATDLDTCEIYIQWTNAGGKSGVSAPWVVDIESESNKIIVGWALSSDITEAAGNLRFALRFFKWDNETNKTLNYSWSTLTQTAVVKPSLDFNFRESGQLIFEEESDKAIINRMVNSNTQLAGIVKAEKPIFVTDLIEFADLEKNTQYLDKCPTCKEVYKLEAQARSTDGGYLSYFWKYINQHGEEQNAVLGGPTDPTNTKVEIEFRKVDITEDTLETIRNSKKIFYKKVTGPEGDEYHPTLIPSDWQTASKLHVYEKITLCIVNRVGTYFVVAENRLRDKNTAETKSKMCVIPMPINPVVTTNLTEKEILGPEVHKDAVPPDKEEIQPAKVTLSLGVNNHETNGTKDGVMTYAWFKKRIIEASGKEAEGDTFSEILDEDGQKITKTDAAWIKIDNQDQSTLTLTNTEDFMNDPKKVEGNYMAIAYNYKNLKYTETRSTACKVSYAAVPPKISYPALNDDLSKVDFSNKEKLRQRVRVELDGPWKNKWNISDGITYQWYKTDDDITGVDNDTKLENETGDKFVPEEPGKYYCQVTNHKNGTTAVATTPIFYVV